MTPKRPSVNRRDLLRFRRGSQSETPAQSSDLLRASRPAMGSYFEIRLSAIAPGAIDLADRALNLVESLESQMTIYRPDSEISLLNASAHLAPFPVEPRLFALLQQAVTLSQQTQGAYDITSGALSEAWGFVKGPKHVPDPQALDDARARTGTHHLTLDPDHQTVSFDRPGIVVNLGSIGKGYAIDRASALIKAHWWPTSALVHGGRSSLYALGSPPGRFAGRWEVALRNPFSPETPLGLLRLRNRGMGTSGASFQNFEAGGRLFGHLIDPRTGEPANGPASLTVLAPSAALADALSTAFYLLGPDAASQYNQLHPEVGFLFVLEGPSDASPKILTLGLTDHDFQSS